MGISWNHPGNAKLWVGSRLESAWERQAMGWEPLGTILGTPSYGLGTVGNRLVNAKLWVGNRWDSAWERKPMGWEPLGIGLGTQTYGLGTVGHIWEPAWERKPMGGNRHPVSGLKF